MMPTSRMASKLAGKVAIVTASTDGIGLAIVRRLAQDGAHVVVSSRKENNVQKTVSTLKSENLDVHGMVCHVGQAEDRKHLVAETVKRKGRLDILVSNAGVNPYFGPILDTPESMWDKTFDVNLKAAFYLCKEAVPHIEKQGGSVVFVSSIAGYNPYDFLGAYSVSKTALFGLTKALTKELAAKNIRVNAIAPGIIKTKFSKAIYESENAKSMVQQQIPMNRLGESEDCSGVVSFLVSDDAKYVTGETILATGGMTARL